MGELAADDEWQIINDNEHYPLEDYYTSEQETDLEQSEIERRETTNLRCAMSRTEVIRCRASNQLTAEQHAKTEDPLFRWTATDRPLEIPPVSPSIIDGDVDKDFCPGSGGRTYPHQKFDDKEAQGSEGNE